MNARWVSRLLSVAQNELAESFWRHTTLIQKKIWHRFLVETRLWSYTTILYRKRSQWNGENQEKHLFARPGSRSQPKRLRPSFLGLEGNFADWLQRKKHYCECTILGNTSAPSVRRYEVKKRSCYLQGCCEDLWIKISHPSYSPDLAQGDYYLFAKLKVDLRGEKILQRRRASSSRWGPFWDWRQIFFMGIPALRVWCFQRDLPSVLNLRGII